MRNIEVTNVNLFREVRTGIEYAGATWLTYDSVDKTDTQKRKRPAMIPQNATSFSLTQKRLRLVNLGRERYSDAGYNGWRDVSYYALIPQSIHAWNQVPSDYSELEGLLANKIIGEIMDGRSQTAVDLFELGKTKDLVAEIGMGLFHQFRDLRRGTPLKTFIRKLNKEGFSGAAGSSWLKYIYGIVPTISGVHEAVDNISQNIIDGSITLGTVGFKRRMYTEGLDPYGHNFYKSYIAKCSAKYQYVISDPKARRLAQLGFTNPAAIAYELMPWSFVIDWFVDFGGYLNRLDWMIGVGDFYYETSIDRRVLIKHDCFKDSFSNPLLRPSIGTSSFRESRRSGARTTLLPYFKGFKKFTNEAERLTTSVALIQQLSQTIKRVS